MYSTKSVALSLALFLALVEIGSCLQCFHCDSQKDPKCGKTFTSAVKAIDCSTQDSIKYNQLNLYNVLPPDVFGGTAGAPRYCHKLVLGTGTVIRTCLDGNASKMQQTCETMKEETKISSLDKQIVECTVCKDDNCNGAGSLSVSLPLTALTVAITYLLLKQ